MALAISCRLLTAEAQVRAWVSTRGICGRQSVTGTGFLRVFRFSLVNIIPPWFFLLIYHLRMYNRPLAGLSLETQSHPSTWTTLVVCILYQKVCSLTVRRVPHWVKISSRSGTKGSKDVSVGERKLLRYMSKKCGGRCGLDSSRSRYWPVTGPVNTVMIIWVP
jgi:hypothetical protein